MIAAAYEFTLLQDNDTVSIFEHRQAVRHDDHSAIFGDLRQIFPDNPFAFRVQ